MKHEHHKEHEVELTKKHIFAAAFLIVFLVVVSNLATYYFLTENFKGRVDVLNSSILSLGSKLESKAAELKQETELKVQSAINDISTLETKTLKNFEELEDFVNSKTQTLQLDLESQLSSVENQIGGLEVKIGQIEVESTDFTGIIEDVSKAVVSIRTDKGQGSGVIYEETGYIMTNRHVIEDASIIQAVDYNSAVYNARLVGIAENADLAVLKIEGTLPFKYLKFETNVQVGQRVIAVGNPFGLSFTVTEGIISGLDRDIDSYPIGYIQTDVSINQGNSGGPLINTAKRIVGINTYKLTAGEGIGFAIPAPVAKDIGVKAIESDANG